MYWCSCGNIDHSSFSKFTAYWIFQNILQLDNSDTAEEGYQILEEEKYEIEQKGKWYFIIRASCI